MSQKKLQEPMAARQSKLLNGLIVLGTIATVVGPIAAPAFRRERAKWELAAALNAVELKSGTLEEKLEQASTDLGNLSDQHDFWVYLVEKALIESPHDLPSIMLEAKTRDPAYMKLGNYVLSELNTKTKRRFHKDIDLRIYHHAPISIEVTEILLADTDRDNPLDLNQLAYLRALVSLDLDQALKDINRALEGFPEVYSLRDTRAWVLYQMGRPVEAFEDADFAVKAYDQEVEAFEKSSAGMLDRFLNFLFSGPDPSADKVLNSLEAGPTLWTGGVIRYHRMKILENLGRLDEANVDRAWLVEHRLPTDERMN